MSKLTPEAAYDLALATCRTCTGQKITPKALAAYETCKGVHRLQWNDRVADLQLDDVDRLMAELLLENYRGMSLVRSGPPADHRVIYYSEFLLRYG